MATQECKCTPRQLASSMIRIVNALRKDAVLTGNSINIATAHRDLCVFYQLFYGREASDALHQKSGATRPSCTYNDDDVSLMQGPWANMSVDRDSYDSSGD